MIVDLTTEDAKKIMKLSLRLNDVVDEFRDTKPEIVVTALLNKMVFFASQSELGSKEFEHYLMFALNSFDDLKKVKEKTDEVATD